MFEFYAVIFEFLLTKFCKTSVFINS